MTFAVLTSGCSGVDATKPAVLPVVDSEAGPVALQVRSAGAAGIPDAVLVRLVQAGIRQGCRGKANARMDFAATPELSMAWDVVRSGPRPFVILSATLFSGAERIGFAYDQALLPDAAPAGVFVGAIADITCAVYRDAGYLTASAG